MQALTIQEINNLGESDFITSFAHVYEHSPWVIERAGRTRPFPNLKVFQAACESALYGADRETQIALIQAHPDLAAKLDQLAGLTEFSQAEQKRAGFAALPSPVLERMRFALASYREKFGHPFILCVSEHAATDVLPLLETRTKSNADSERLACLFQIGRIGWYRLKSLITE